MIYNIRKINGIGNMILNIPVALLQEWLIHLRSWGRLIPLFWVKLLVLQVCWRQQALFGQMCVQPGDVKNTYGTGCFV